MSKDSQESQRRQVAEWLREARFAVAFTGAGISTESGIPDFRSPGGIWARYRPVYYQQFVASAEARYEYWQQKCEAHREFADAKANVAHEILASWESRNLLEAVVTQNIDGLHQQAGSKRVLELHGTAREVGCLDCASRFDPEPLIAQFLEADALPPCPRCGKDRLKSATISFGQPLPEDVLEEAIELSRTCDFFLALGSALVVEPAASLPRLARQSGARLVIINRDPPDQDTAADLVLHASIGETLSGVDQCLNHL